MLKLAFRNTFRHRLRTAITLAAIVSGVAAIVVSGGFIEDSFVQLREATIHSRLGHLQVFHAGYSKFGRRDPVKYSISDPAKLVERLTALPHVKEVLARSYFSGMASNGKGDIPIRGEGIEPDAEARLGSALTIVAGRQLTGSDQYGALIGEGVAGALQLKPGSYVTVTVSTPEGALNTLEFNVIGVFRSFSKDYDDRAVRVPLSTAKELLFSNAVHSIIAVLDRTENTDRVVQALTDRLDSGRYEIKPWYELADFYNKTVALYRRQFATLQAIILIMVLLGVASTVNMTIYERTGEFGTLLALGNRRGQIFRLVLVENIILGLTGAALGVGIGALLSLVLSQIGIQMPPPPGSNTGYVASIRIVPSVLALASVVGAVAAVLASLFPARRASKLHIVNALRQNI